MAQSDRQRLDAISTALQKMSTDLGNAQQQLEVVKAYVLKQTHINPLPTPEESDVLVALYKLETILN